ncbi:MAG: ABC transporter ATP-binding protein [Candidatus Competibacterales bacterium]
MATAADLTVSASGLLSVQNLRVEFATQRGPLVAVEDLSFDLTPGETLGIVGESGSGKSVTSLALMGLLPYPQGRVTRGQAWFDGRDLLAMAEHERRQLRGNALAMIFQEPMTSLNPVLTIGVQLTEGLRYHQGLSYRQAKARALEMLEQVRIPDARRRLGQYPHHLSGGMRQRVMIAMAMASHPKVLIADEPTTALDVTIQAQILALMKDLQQQYNTALILITHDMGVIAETADRVVVMYRGKTVEQGPVGELFAHPQGAYTRRLLDAVPKLGAMTGKEGPEPFGTAAPAAGPSPASKATAPGEPLLTVEDLTVRFDLEGSPWGRSPGRIHAVEQVSFAIGRGETLALVGESGCGKSTTGRALLNLVPAQGGRVNLDGREILGLGEGAMRPYRQRMQMIFQDAFAALNPRQQAGFLVAEPLIIQGTVKEIQRREQVAALFERVGLEPDHQRRYPHQFSGGQRQRLCIARALSLRPELIIADEPVSALDVSIQAQIVDLLLDLQNEFGLSYLFISHDMAVVERIAHRVAVMYLGRIVEMGSRRAVFENPVHPYTQKLLRAVPVADPSRPRPERSLMTEEIKSPMRPLDYQVPTLAMTQVAADHWVLEGYEEAL